MTLALEGYRILELGAAVASPYCTALCADLGAEVIKIETRRRPDNMRFASSVDPAPNPLDGGLIYNGINRNKRGVLLDLTQREGRDLFLELVKTADAVVENFSAGIMDRMGVGYEVLCEVRPDLVMLSLSGFGATGPLKDYVAYGIVLEGMAGMMHIEGYPDGPPIETPFTYNDYISALYGFHLLNAALYRRAHTGEGFYADFSEAEVTLHLVNQGVFDWMLNGRNRGRQGNHDDAIPIHGCYPCRGDDAWVAVVAATDEHWHGLCRAIGREDWLAEADLATHEGRMARRDELEEEIRRWTRRQTPEEATQALQRHGVAAGPANRIDQALADRHVQARETITRDALHPHTAGRLLPTPPLRISGVPREIRLPAPTWGRDHGLVFAELLGLAQTEVARLEAGGVLA